jgi:DNA-cytosine methyltransferase
MNVLSLFDGMSCGRIALDELGIKVDTYYACEIDKFAMQVSNKNYPDIIQLGDVTKVKGADLKKIDLIIGGSPCQGFSFAGKQLAFDDPRSALFFEFIRLREECNPKYFLLENVRMKREHEDIISEYTGFEPIMINSSKLSAQNRVRLYWTNIPNITQPKDTGVVLKDILQNSDEWGEQPRYLKNKWNGVPRGDNVSELNEKGSFLTASMFEGQVPLFVKKETSNEEYLKQMTTDEGKAYCLTASYTAAEPNNSLQRKQRTMIPKSELIIVGNNIEQVKVRKHKVDVQNLQHALKVYKEKSNKTNKQIAEEINLPTTKVEHWFRTDSSFAIPSDDIWHKLKEILCIPINTFDSQIMEFEYKDSTYESTQRVYSEEGKAPTLTTSNKDQMIETRPKQIGIAVDINGNDQIKRVYSKEGKSPTLTTCTGGHREPKVACGRMVGRHKIDGVRQDYKGSIAGKSKQMLELRKDEKTNTLSTVPKDNVVVTTKPNQINSSKKANGVQPHMQDRVFHVDGKSHALTTEFASRTNVGEIIDVDKKNKKLIIKEATKQGYAVIDDGDCFDLSFPESKTRRGRSMKDKSNCLTAANFDFMRYEHSEEEKEVYWRKLTPVECERLQTVPDNYTEGVSNSQRYRMLGNGWTVSVIKHIFINMKTEDQPVKPNFKKQQSLF